MKATVELLEMPKRYIFSVVARKATLWLSYFSFFTLYELLLGLSSKEYPLLFSLEKRTAVGKQFIH